MPHRIIPAIMSGGAGTRLWPTSSEARPKQFHALGGAKSLFAATLDRLVGEIDGVAFAPPIVLCNESHAELVTSELADAGVSAAAIVLEPAPRNTAAVAAVAAALAREIDPDALVLLLPSDHVVSDVQSFHAAIEKAAPFTRERVVTFGVTPNRPATGYGYIKQGVALGPGVFAVEHFREKPDVETAQKYVDESGYSWNSGIFLFRPRTLLSEFEPSADIREGALEALARATRDAAWIRLDPETFGRVRALPFDVAVMEKTRRAAVVPCEMGWADLGAWDEIWRLSERDERGNAVRGSVVALDATNNLLRADGVRLCVAGISDLIVVATGDAVIVVRRDRAEDVKALRELGAKLDR